ncbi:MAG: 30S ribosomal protein S18 [Proteobacteria bacterium]|nr:30S ribosomal protein S18 [Pseudomonadota bacterium]
MAREHYDNDDDSAYGRSRADTDPITLRRKGGKRKVCRYCAETDLEIDYKDPQQLRLFISERGKIVPRRISGNCARHQRRLTLAIKRARSIALMPYTVRS